MKIRIILIFLNLLASIYSTAQPRNCATVAWEQILKQSSPALSMLKPGAPVFENWMQQKLLESDDKNSALYTIPVVVHIIHNGEALGTGRNVSDERVFSQIRILNEDFRRLPGTPGFNNHPAGVDTRIEFKLAQRTPDGQPTNGIVRLQGSKPTWFLSDNNELKNLSRWPEDDYLNLWVCDLASDMIGYAQFPLPFDSLPYSGQYQNIMPDGVVIDYQTFGEVPPGESGPFPSYNKGRTATHEIGHFLGLLHLWGDVLTGCGDDFCADTPLQEGWTSGCPQSRITCGGPNMFQNYLDYTRDACMNIFTGDQMRRMHVVLRNSPRRKSLTTSLGATPPVNIQPQLSTGNCHVYPNLSDGCFYIEFKNETTLSKNDLSIFSSNGKSAPFNLVREDARRFKVEIHPSKPGIYYMLINHQSESLARKLIIE